MNLILKKKIIAISKNWNSFWTLVFIIKNYCHEKNYKYYRNSNYP